MIRLGIIDGVDEGTTVGKNDGWLKGVKLGETLGIIDGVDEGTTVGKNDGWLDSE